MRFTAEISAPFAFLFSGVIAGVYVHHLFLEKRFDRLFDLNLVSARTNAKDVFVLCLAQERGLLCQRGGFNDVEGFVHLLPFLSASFASPPSVIKIFSKESSCSVFTSLALASVTALTLRADLQVFSSNPSDTIRIRFALVCFLSNWTNTLVLISFTANSPIVSTSPAPIRSLRAF